MPGTDDWEYQWEDEEITEDIRIPNGDTDDDENSTKSMANGDDLVRKKSVSFAQQELQTSVSVDSLSSQAGQPINGSTPIQSKIILNYLSVDSQTF